MRRFVLLMYSFAILAAAALYVIPAQAGGERVAFAAQGIAPGTIVIRNSERRLYLVLGQGQALAYTNGASF